MINYALNTKINVMISKLLNENDYKKLTKLNSLALVINELKIINDGYRKIFEEFTDGNMIKRQNIENRLMLCLINCYENIFKFINNVNIKRYIKLFYLKLKIDLIKLGLSAVKDKRDLSLEYYESDKLGLDTSRLFSDDINNIEDFFNVIRDTEFFDVINQPYIDKHNLFELDTKLDFYYYEKVFKFNKLLSGGEKKILDEINKIELEMLNIIYIYRLKVFFAFDKDKIYAYLAPRKYKLSSSDINKLIAVDNKIELEDLIISYKNNKVFKNKEFSIEKFYYYNLNYFYKKYAKFQKNSVVRILYYIFLKKIEINNITSLIEGIRYRLNPESILNYLYFM
ncbi:MAG: V-type ATPase subunit [Clostridiales bacterium]|nr:V-type ATPase subunit [Clostridiales bacterium]